MNCSILFIVYWIFGVFSNQIAPSLLLPYLGTILLGKNVLFISIQSYKKTLSNKKFFKLVNAVNPLILANILN